MKKHIVLILWLTAAVIMISTMIMVYGLEVSFSNIQIFMVELVFYTLIDMAMLIQTLRNRAKNKYRHSFICKLIFVIGFYTEIIVHAVRIYLAGA